MKTKHFSLVLAPAVIIAFEILASAAEPAATPPPPPPAKARHASFQPPSRTFTNLTMLHEAYSHDFAQRPGFGRSRILFLPPQDFFTQLGETYRFDAPELLGLENEPVVYMRRGRESVTMAELSRKELREQLQQRPPTAEEMVAVGALRAGKEVVTTPMSVAVITPASTNHVAGLLVVGALRAKANCAECHGVKKGTLLGAFSYTLVPTNPASLLTTFLQTPDAPLTTSASIPATLFP